MRGNYTECVREGLPLMKIWMTHDLLQMLLISAQRLEQPKIAEELASFVVSTGSNLDPWSKAMLKLTSSNGDWAKLMEETNKLLKDCRDNKQRCQLLYYLGAKCLTMGKTDEAHDIFAVAAKIEAPCLEQKLAEAAWQFLDIGDSLLSDDDATR
jgi:hypothetical protein